MIYIMKHDISEAGASVISDIILDYVKSPVEGEYTTPNTKKTYQKFKILHYQHFHYQLVNQTYLTVFGLGLM
jgi:hypothetical protein